MLRKARLDAPEALHHIVVRGIERRKIFRDDSDRDDFLERLEAILGESCQVVKSSLTEYLKAFYTDRNEKSRILCGSI